MPFRDLHEYVDRLRSAGMLYQVKAEVDKDWELSTIFRVMWKRYPNARRYPVIFERVKGFNMPVVVGTFGTSREIYAFALETTTTRVRERWSAALKDPVEPVLVQDGPCKERIFKGNDVDLFRFPMCRWHVLNRAPYITAGGVVTKDPDTGIRNVGTYASMLVDRDRMTLRGGATSHLGIHHCKYEERGLAMPVAVVVGAEPSIGMVAVAGIPDGMDEFAVAGALRQERVELVKCETVDIEVPAASEIVIEGVVPPGERLADGPHVDHCGYLLPTRDVRSFRVQCITTRREPIYQEYDEGKPPHESSIIRGVAWESIIRHKLVSELGYTSVRDIRATEGSSAWGTFIVSIKKSYEAEPVRIGAALLVAANRGKRVIVVDDDVDIYDDTDVEWAQAFCVRWDRDLHLLPAMASHPLDPSVGPSEQYIHGRGEKYFRPSSEAPAAVVIDATRKSWFPSVGHWPKEKLGIVEEKWPQYGLP